MDVPIGWAMPLNVVITMVLCVVAFAIGLRRRQYEQSDHPGVFHGTARARKAADALSRSADELWNSLRKYRWRLNRFRQRINCASGTIDVQEMERAVAMLRRLSSDLGLARLRVREQMDQLVALTESRVDTVTGVANRRAFDEELDALVGRFQHTGAPFALALIDVDGIREVNSALGYPTGDRLLRQMAIAAVESAGSDDFVARAGGTQFGILLDSADRQSARDRADRIRNALQSAGAHIEGPSPAVAVAAGIAFAGRGDAADTLVARADADRRSAKVEHESACCA